MTSNNGLLSIEKLSGRDNYATWSFAVKAYLQLEDLWECIEPESGKSVDAKKDIKAKSKLILLIDPIIYVHVREAQTSKEVWENLMRAFEDSGLTRKVGLLKDLINTTLETSASIEDYVNKIMSSAHRLRNIGFKVDDEWLGTLMLAGLPDVYKPMIMAIESSGVKICADSIKTKLLQEVKTVETTAFYSNSRRQDNKKSDKGQGQSKSKGPRCFFCNKYGHLSKNCWHKKNKSDNKDNGFIAAFSATSATTHNDSLNWYVDSGASRHMTLHREWLEDERAPPVTSIRIADNNILKVQSCGDVTIKVPDTQGNISKIQVRNVLYVPDIGTNLISVSKTIKSGCKIEFDEIGCQIINKQTGLKVADAIEINDMYKLNTIKEKVHAMPAAVADDDNFVWHQRMGHLNFKDMEKVPNCTTGVKLSPCKENITCISCIEGKQTRQPFPGEGSRATELLEVIHSDVCGPMQTASLGGARYFVTFIDDFSRKVYVFTMKSKAEVFDKFVEYKARVENEHNRKIKTLRTDNGKEYVNKIFDNYLKKFGILHQTTNPYTPEQNGLCERMNRTLVERSKCMVLNAQLQNNFWGEAVVTAAHIINRSPTRALSYVTPEEVWTGKKPDLSYMKIFGCKAMVHIPKERRQKLDPKSRELIFVGYSDSVKGYRFIDPKNKQTITSRDVVFLEATVKRNIINNESAPEKEKVISNERKDSTHEGNVHDDTSAPEKEKKISDQRNDVTQEMSKKKLSHKREELNLPKPKTVYLPLPEEREEDDDNNSVGTDELNSTFINIDSSSSPTSVYSDPNDESYIPEESIEIPQLDRNLRPRRREEIYEADPPQDDASFMCMNSESAMSILDKDPQSLSEALQSNKAEQWIHAMKEEHKSLLDNNTWTLVDLPKNKKVIPCKWVYKTKTDEKGNVSRLKARLVVKGYQQKKGIDYHEIYAPVVRYTSIRYVIGLAVKYNLKIHQMDAVTAFLQGDIEENIYMSQPPYFEEGDKVCLLKKSIYGLKQASRQWNKKLNAALLEIGMSRSRVDPCIYHRIVNEKDILILTVYVDDLLCFYNNEKSVKMIKKKLSTKFHMKDLGEAKCCIGFRITQEKSLNEMSLDQTMYIEKVLTRFNMSDCKPVHTPCEANLQLKKAENDDDVLKDIPYQELIGCLLYLSQGTRPDIAYIVNQLSRFNNKPTAQHWMAAKRVLRYLRGTQNLKLTFKKNNANIVGYCDADWASDTEDRRSCSGYVFTFQGAAISWCSKRQPTIALSSTEAEYMSLATATQEAIWLKQLEEDFWPTMSGIPIVMFCDNQSAISISGDDIYHARSKHIDIRYHFVRERITNKQISVRYKSTQDMLADVLTKGLHRPKHQTFSMAMGLCPEEGVGNRPQT